MSDECIQTPMLAIDGSNWVNYRDWLIVIFQFKKLKDHLVSDTVTCYYTDAGDVNGCMPAQHWADNQILTKAILNTSILDTIYTQVKGVATLKAIWHTLKTLLTSMINYQPWEKASPTRTLQPFCLDPSQTPIKCKYQASLPQQIWPILPYHLHWLFICYQISMTIAYALV